MGREDASTPREYKAAEACRTPEGATAYIERPDAASNQATSGPIRLNQYQDCGLVFLKDLHL